MRVVPAYFRDRRVLEIACGTGYWTAAYAPVAAAVTATDIGSEVLALARRKPVPSTTTFAIADAYALSDVPGDFDAGLAGFWWSHVPLGRLDEFLRGFHRRLGGGARAMILDNRYVAGSNVPIGRVDADGNSYQHRRLDDGSEHEVLKNFPTIDEVRSRLARAGAVAVEVSELGYYWYATYEVARGI